MKITKQAFKTVQNALKSIGFDVGPIDGIPGPRSTKAIQDLLNSIQGTGSTTSEPDERPAPDTDLDPKPWKGPVPGWTPTVIVHKGISYSKLGKFKTPSGTPDGAVVHYTVSGNSAKSAEAVVRSLASRGLGCPVVDAQGIIHVPEGFNWETDIGYHAGKSLWRGKSGVSNTKIGFEMCSWGSAALDKNVPADQIRFGLANNGSTQKGAYQKFTAHQEEFLINVMIYLKNKYPKTFTVDGICGHDECATPLGRKNDPGASLSMSMPDFRQLIRNL